PDHHLLHSFPTRRSSDLTCRTSSSPGQCRTSCLADVAAARKACRTDLTDCRTSCPPPSPCTGACGQQMASCMRGVQTTGKSCGQDRKSTRLNSSHDQISY